MDESSNESAAWGNFPSRTTCERTNHLSKNCCFKGKPQIQCNNCKRLRHRGRYYRFKPNQTQQ